MITGKKTLQREVRISQREGGGTSSKGPQDTTWAYQSIPKVKEWNRKIGWRAMVYDSQVILQLGARLGPGNLSWSTGSWTNVFSSSRIQRNNKGLKPTSHMHSWGKSWTIRYKKATNQLLVLSWEEKQGTTHDLCTQHHHRRWADHLTSTSAQLTNRPPSSPTFFEPRESRAPVPVSSPHAATQIPIEPCLNSHPTPSISSD